MAMTYADSASLMSDMAFRGRVKVAAMKFATTVMNEAPDVVAHNARMRWAQTMYTQPDMVAGQLQPPTVMDPAVQSAGPTVDDSTLQSAVEAIINKLI